MNGSHKKLGLYISLYILFALIGVYAIQDFQTSANTGMKGAERGAVHAALFILLLFLAGYFAKRAIRGELIKSPVILVLGLITVWVGAVNLMQNLSGWAPAVHLGISALWILIYFFFSYYVRRYPKAWPHIQVCVAIMFGFYVFSALYAYYILQALYGRIVAVNLVYNVLVFLPWLTLMSSKWARRLGYVLVFIVVLVSMKRGAIIAYPILISAWILMEAVPRKKVGRAIVQMVVALALFIGGLQIVDQSTGGFLSERFSAESLASGSGRAQSYYHIVENVSNRSPADFLIGTGSGSSIQLLGTGAHNEWLEFLYSFGIIGVVLYLLLFLALVGRIRRLSKQSSPYTAAVAMAVVYILVVGMVGGIYFVHSTLYIVAFLGVVEGMMINDERRKASCSEVLVQGNREVVI